MRETGGMVSQKGKLCDACCYTTGNINAILELDVTEGEALCCLLLPVGTYVVAQVPQRVTEVEAL